MNISQAIKLVLAQKDWPVTTAAADYMQCITESYIIQVYLNSARFTLQIRGAMLVESTARSFEQKLNSRLVQNQ